MTDNSRLCETCSKCIGSFRYWYDVHKDIEMDHHPSVKSLYESAQVGCQLCTLVYAYYFADFFDEDKPLPSYLTHLDKDIDGLKLTCRFIPIDPGWVLNFRAYNPKKIEVKNSLSHRLGSFELKPTQGATI